MPLILTSRMRGSFSRPRDPRAHIGSPHNQAAAQAGHASIESTRIYLHLADDWLASQYRKAVEVIDARLFAEHPAAGSAR